MNKSCSNWIESSRKGEEVAVPLQSATDLGKRSGKLFPDSRIRPENEKSPPFGGDHYRQASQIRLSFGCSFIGRLQLSKVLDWTGFQWIWTDWFFLDRTVSLFKGLEKEKLTDTGFLVFFRIGFKKLTGRVFRILDWIDVIDQSTSDANIQPPGTPGNRDFALISGYGNYLRIRRSTWITHRSFTC